MPLHVLLEQVVHHLLPANLAEIDKMIVLVGIICLKVYGSIRVCIINYIYLHLYIPSSCFRGLYYEDKHTHISTVSSHLAPTDRHVAELVGEGLVGVEEEVGQLVFAQVERTATSNNIENN